MELAKMRYLAVVLFSATIFVFFHYTLFPDSFRTPWTMYDKTQANKSNKGFQSQYALSKNSNNSAATLEKHNKIKIIGPQSSHSSAKLEKHNEIIKPFFPIDKETFFLTEHKHRIWTNQEMATFILGKKKADMFLNNIKHRSLAEVQPMVFDYTINNKTTCDSAAPIRYILSVYSAPRNFLERRAVRNTWGRQNLFLKQRSRTVFLLGAVKDAKLQKQIEEESRQYGDIIQANFSDSYRNLSHKGISMLQWVNQFCTQTQYLIKADDDLFVDIFQVVKVLEAVSNLPRFIAGVLYPNSTIFRDDIKNSSRDDIEMMLKFIIKPDLMPGQDNYPPYFLGWTYILPKAVLSDLYKVALKTPVFHIDDVYMTGLLAGQMEDFVYVSFNGTAPTGHFMPTHDKMAKECGILCKSRIWCQQIKKLVKSDRAMLADGNIGTLLTGNKC